MSNKHAGVTDKICHYCEKKVSGDGVKSGAKFFCSELCHVAHLKKMPKKAPPSKATCRFC